MTATKYRLDHSLKSVRQGGLREAIKHHKSARLNIDKTIDVFPDDSIAINKISWLDGPLEKAVQDEEKARLAFLRYPAAGLEDVRAKAHHVRLLLAEGDELDSDELDLLLLSMI